MSDSNYRILFLVLAALLMCLFFGRGMVQALIEAINRFRGGGPPTPMHPSPAGDDRFLRKRRAVE